jgi:4-hydroxymandelate oxidase
MRLEPGSLYDYEARAQQVLPHDYWDFIAGGSKDELTTRRNRSAFDAMSLRPRFLRDVTERKLETTVLGTPISFPVMLCPTGGHKLAHPEGECATARGAGMSNTLMMLSTSSHCSLEEVAKVATGPLWFQLYHRGYDVTKMLVQRAEQAGYKAIVLTVDTPLPAPKERDIRNRYANPFPLANSPRSLPSVEVRRRPSAVPGCAGPFVSTHGEPDERSAWRSSGCTMEPYTRCWEWLS